MDADVARIRQLAKELGDIADRLARPTATLVAGMPCTADVVWDGSDDNITPAGSDDKITPLNGEAAQHQTFVPPEICEKLDRCAE